MSCRIIISLFFTVLFSAVASASSRIAVLDTLKVEADSMHIDTLSVADTVATKDSINKVIDRGYDVSKYLGSKRKKPQNHTAFNNKTFFSNTFIGVRGSAIKVMTPDYGFGPTAGGVIGKWVHPAVAVRLGAGVGYWHDNFDAIKIREINLSADVMFNMMSYLGGYNTARFCEMSVVGGLGYTHVWKKLGDQGDALSAHVGLNFDLRIFDCLHLFVEPQVNLFFNPRQGSQRKGVALSSAGDWRSYMPAFNSFVGLAYNFGQTKPSSQHSRLSGSWKNPALDWNGYYVSTLAGLQVHLNSRLVWKGNMKAGERVGMHCSLGGGRWFTKYLGIRASASYSQNNWIKYLTNKPLRSRYLSVRLEGVLDVVNLARYLIDKRLGVENHDDNLFGLAILAGPEIGHMVKHDRASSIHDHYIGLAGGVQARFRVHKLVSVVAEPRFTLVPYSAPHFDQEAKNDNKNYYDALLNFNIGLQFNILKMPTRKIKTASDSE